uniref:Arabidopsis retrotransposon Orf1 C-terminal domain-containing protein n=1 Tax=Chenopodium quinoa TaxID=63459 RepID=A0A803LM06_CHEQI
MRTTKTTSSNPKSTPSSLAPLKSTPTKRNPPRKARAPPSKNYPKPPQKSTAPPHKSPPPTSHPSSSLSKEALGFSLQDRKIKPTLCYSQDNGKKLGVDDFLQEIGRRCGWSKVLNLKEEVYPDLVIEFLNSLVVSDNGDISFSLDGVSYSMAPKEVNEIFGWPCDGTIGPSEFGSFWGDKNGLQFHQKMFWRELTGRDDWKVGLTKSFSIVNPMPRILHRLLLQVFFPKTEMGQIATSDFKMLWRFLHGDRDRMGQLDFGKFLIAAFLVERNKPKWPITMGSFVKGEEKDSHPTPYAVLPTLTTRMGTPDALLFPPTPTSKQSSSQEVIDHFGNLEQRFHALNSEVVSLRQQIVASGTTATSNGTTVDTSSVDENLGKRG